MLLIIGSVWVQVDMFQLGHKAPQGINLFLFLARVSGIVLCYFCLLCCWSWQQIDGCYCSLEITISRNTAKNIQPATRGRRPLLRVQQEEDMQ